MISWYETSQGEEHKLTVLTKEALRERNFGAHEGKALEELRDELSDFYDMRENMPYDEWKKIVMGVNRETDEELISRFINIIREISIAYAGKRVLIIGHVSTMKNLLVHLGITTYRELKGKKPTDAQISDLLFAWAISQVSKSNCVVAVKNDVLVASGVGQQDRRRCCELCVSKAIKPLTGAVAATDGFFPFRDGPDILIRAGIKAIIQPGGSIRDQETIDACDEKGVAMIMTGVRAFKH